MVKLTREQISELLASDFDERLGRDTAMTDDGRPILESVIEACGELCDSSEELFAGGQFSVAASLPGVSSAASATSAEILSLLTKTLQFTTGSDVYSSDAKDWSFIEDSLDGLFARIDECVAADAGRVVKRTLDKPVITEAALSGKPQAAWADSVDNYRAMFVPLLKEKLNAIEPLNPLILEAQSNPSILKNRSITFGNVYEVEIRKCMKSVSAAISEIESVKEITEFTDLQSTELVYVDTDAALDHMIEDVMAAGEVAIDLEHHDIHSYRGFTSLIQLSTRDKDYIVDPFPIFKSVHKLNKFTTDPNIRKTLHGADMDVQWLQRDFGVYIVNMFDTGQAARVLGLAGGFGLANLLDTFCKVKTNKRFQMADWRKRPLTEDMLNYARIDTHYLLYIRDRLENLIVSMGGGGGITVYGKKMLVQVMEKSFGISSKVYKDNGCDFDPDAIRQFCLKAPALKVGQIRSNPKAMAILRAVLRWRDEVARRTDESRHYVLTNSACLRLANAMPSTVPQILRALSYESSSGFPSLRIGTAEADGILAVIAIELAKLDATAVTAVSVDVEMEEAEMPCRKSSSNAAVRVGEFGNITKRKSSGHTRLSTESARPPHVPQSALFSLFAKRGSVEGQSTQKREAVLASIRSYLTECPEILKRELERYLVSKTEVTAEPVEADEECAMQVDTEFVAFTNKPVKKSVSEMVHAGEMPPTVREQRKRANEPHTGSNAKAGKKASAASSSAAAKALEFIEQELSLGRK